MYRLLDAEFQFTLDACATPANAKHARWLGTQLDGRFIDALTVSWSDVTHVGETMIPGVVFVNPPYSRGQLRRWLAKAHVERDKGATVVLLIPSDRSTQAWQQYVVGEEIRDLRSRVDYGVGVGAKFASAVIVLRPRVFYENAPWFITAASPVALVKRRSHGTADVVV